MDGDLLENITRLSRKIEVAETESQLAPRIESGILGERLSAAGAPRDFLRRFSFERSSTAPQGRFTVPHVEVVEEESCALDVTSASGSEHFLYDILDKAPGGRPTRDCAEPSTG